MFKICFNKYLFRIFVRKRLKKKNTKIKWGISADKEIINGVLLSHLVMEISTWFSFVYGNYLLKRR